MHPYPTRVFSLFIIPTMSKELATSLNDLQFALRQTGESDSNQQRDVALKRELEQLQMITNSIDKVYTSLKSSNENVSRIISSSYNSNKLVDVWIKILSQNRYTSDLLSDESWEGQSKDESLWESKLQNLQKLQTQQEEIRKKRRLEEESAKRRNKLRVDKEKERREVVNRRVYGSRGNVRKPISGSAGKRVQKK